MSSAQLNVLLTTGAPSIVFDARPDPYLNETTDPFFRHSLLKNAILHRKNSLHYRTQRGADVGDTFMTVIETCRANGVNPFDYMLAIVRNPKAVRADPGRWMPWNYEQATAGESGDPPTPQHP